MTNPTPRERLWKQAGRWEFARDHWRREARNARISKNPDLKVLRPAFVAFAWTARCQYRKLMSFL